MDENLILTLVKQRLGFTSTVRDTYLQHIVKSVLDNLIWVRGIDLDPERSDHTFFVVKCAVWEYQNKEKGEVGMPVWMRLELNNLMMKSKG